MEKVYIIYVDDGQIVTKPLSKYTGNVFVFKNNTPIDITDIEMYDIYMSAIELQQRMKNEQYIAIVYDSAPLLYVEYPKNGIVLFDFVKYGKPLRSYMKKHYEMVDRILYNNMYFQYKGRYLYDFGTVRKLFRINVIQRVSDIPKVSKLFQKEGLPALDDVSPLVDKNIIAVVYMNKKYTYVIGQRGYNEKEIPIVFTKPESYQVEDRTLHIFDTSRIFVFNLDSLMYVDNIRRNIPQIKTEYKDTSKYEFNTHDHINLFDKDVENYQNKYDAIQIQSVLKEERDIVLKDRIYFAKPSKTSIKKYAVSKDREEYMKKIYFATEQDELYFQFRKYILFNMEYITAHYNFRILHSKDQIPQIQAEFPEEEHLSNDLLTAFASPKYEKYIFVLIFEERPYGYVYSKRGYSGPHPVVYRIMDEYSNLHIIDVVNATIIDMDSINEFVKIEEEAVGERELEKELNEELDRKIEEEKLITLYEHRSVPEYDEEESEEESEESDDEIEIILNRGDRDYKVEALQNILSSLKI